MRSSLSEYGRVIIASIIGLISLIILFSSGAFMDFVDSLRPDNPEVRNEDTKLKLANLQNRKKPEFIFIDPQIQLGDSILISDLILQVRDADGIDIKNKVEYYLGDGTKVTSTYPIRASQMETLNFRFYVEDNHGIYTNKKFAIIINNKGPVNDASIFQTEWDIGDSVKAKIFTYEEDGINKTTLYVTGNGKANSYPYGRPPWTRDGYNNDITEVVIDPGVIMEDISNWFQNFTKLEKIPDFYPENNIKNMTNTYENCTSLKTGYIPIGVSNITGIYKGCTRIKSMSEIPTTVERMNEAFSGCVNLRGDLVVKALPYEYNNCFYKVASKTNGISLKVYNTTIVNQFTIQKMVDDALNDKDTNVIYIGQKN